MRKRDWIWEAKEKKSDRNFTRNLKRCRVGGLMGFERKGDRYPKRAIA